MFEIDITDFSAKDIVSWIPSGIWMTLGTCLILTLLAWGVAWKKAFQSEKVGKLKYVIAFPVTHPFVMPFFVAQDFQKARISLFLYLMIPVVWFAGGWVTETIEKRKINQHLATLTARGEPITLESVKVDFDPNDQDNVWTHPKLLPLALESLNGDTAQRDANQNRYESISRPPVAKFMFQYDDSVAKSVDPGLVSLHGAVVDILSQQHEDFQLKMLPNTWASIGKTLMDWYLNSESDFEEIRVAIKRPTDRFPVVWSEGMSVRLPHLSLLKDLTSSTKLRAIALATQGDGEKSHEEALMCLRLASTGDMYTMISSLIQSAQAAIALNAIRSIQQFHLWNEDQWQEVDDLLAQINLPSKMARTYQMERLSMSGYMKPMLNQQTSDILKSLKQLGLSIIPIPEWFQNSPWESAANKLTSSFAKSIVARQWLLYMEYMGLCIEASKPTNSESQTWADFKSIIPEDSVSSQGILSKLLPPSTILLQAEKVFKAQSVIRMGRVAIALEKYYQQHATYPESVEVLSVEFPGLNLNDALTGNRFEFVNTSKDSFELSFPYRTDSFFKGIRNPHAWYVLESIPPVPNEITIDEQSPVMDIEMMKRYGLLPDDE